MIKNGKKMSYIIKINKNIPIKILKTDKTNYLDINLIRKKSFNIIYLIDIPISMKKFKKFIFSLSKINSELKQQFPAMKIGYILCTDFKINEDDKSGKYILIYEPSDIDINISEFHKYPYEFDYYEDWSYPIFQISKIVKEKEPYIVIHICDSYIQEKIFFENDYIEKEKKNYINVLKMCKKKNVKFIGLIIDDYTRKSFYEYKKIYNKLDGYYDIIDILSKNCVSEYSMDQINYILIEKITNILDNRYTTKINDIYYIDESILEIKLHPKIDIVYLLDSSNTISQQFKNACKISISNAKYFSNNFPNIDFKFGAIFYSEPISSPQTDKCDYMQLTKVINKIERFCYSWPIKIGVDSPEDWSSGYESALSDILWRDGRRIIVHISIAPSYEFKFSENEFDDYTEKRNEDKLEKCMQKCAEKNIEIVSIYIGDDTKICFLECKKIYDNNKGRSFKISKYNPKNLFDYIH